jgi:hypothetical protein
MDFTTMDYPRGDQRVSDADRDRALAELSENYQAGRLTTEELDERTGLALRARTGRELTNLLADLPRKQTGGLPRADIGSAGPGTGAGMSAGAGMGMGTGRGMGAGGSLWSGKRRPGGVLGAPIAIVAAVVAVVLLAHGHLGLIALVPVVIVLFLLKRGSHHGSQRGIGYDRGMGYDRRFERRRLHGRRYRMWE